MKIEQFFKQYPEVAVACSGGVDSSYLLALAKQYGTRVKAYFVHSAFQPEFEYEDVKQVVHEIGTELEVLSIQVLEDTTVTSNPKNRCYYCKQVVFGQIIAAAKKDGFDVVLDGTNATDDATDRPGMKALQELGVLSPLKLCGIGKEEVRAGAKEAGIGVHNKPSYACLATRVPTGTTITKELLERVEAAEEILFAYGFSDFRVRVFHDAAKIQLVEEQMPKLLAHREEIISKMTPYFKEMMLDLVAR